MSEQYEVECILAKVHVYGKKTMFLIKWKGYALEESTWEPFENISHLDNKYFLTFTDGKTKNRKYTEYAMSQIPYAYG